MGVTPETSVSPESLTRRAAPLLLLVAVWALTTHRVWLLHESYFLRDFWMNYVPSRSLLKEAFGRGAWPLWNPWIGGGVPVLSDPNNGVFYLPARPFLWLRDQDWALSLAVDVHLLIAALGTYLLSRRWTTRWSAAAAGAVFGLGGLMQSNVVNVHWHFAYAWAPFFFWGVLRLLDGCREAAPLLTRLRWLGVVALVLSLQLTACEPQIVYFQVAALPFLSALWWTQGVRGVRTWTRALVGIAGSGVLAGCIASPQLAALLESLPQSDRGLLSAEDSAIWSLHGGRFWELLLPLPWGWSFPATRFWGESLINGPWNGFYFYSLYVGALTLPLLILAARRLRRPELWMLGAAVFLMLCAFAQTLVFNDLLRKVLPLWSTFRYAERYSVLPTLGLALLVARGLDSLLEKPPRWELLLLLLPVPLALVAWKWPGLLARGQDATVIAETLPLACKHAALMAVGAFLVVGGLQRRTHAELRAALLTLLIALDVASTSPHLLATWTPPAATAFLTGQPDRTVFATTEMTLASARLPAEPATRRQFEDSLNRPNLGIARGIRSVNGVTSMEFARTRRLREAVGLEGAWLAFQGRWLVADHRHHFKAYQGVQNLALGMQLFRHEGPLPEVLCTARWAHADSVDEAVQKVKTGHVVEDAPGSAETPGIPSESAPQEPLCTLTRHTPERWTLSLAAQATPLLARISESYYPGWKAHLPSGEPLATHPVDVAMLGLTLPAGATQVELTFWPTWLGPLLWLRGVATALAALLVLSPLGMSSLRKRS